MTGGGVEEPEQHPQHGGLPRPVRPDETGHTGSDIERQAVERDDVAEAVGEVAE